MSLTILKKNNPSLSFTVGIPTCYGGPSLLATVKSILASKGVDKFCFVVVADRTPIEPAMKKELKRLGVELIWHEKEGSQFKKIKQIVAMCQSDVLVITQDDITFKPNTLANIMRVFASRPQLTMVGARVLPLPAKTRIETILASMVRMVDYITQFWNDDNYLMASGRCLAFRTEQIKKFRIPERVVNGDMFLYLENKRLQGTFARPQDAIVYIRCPQQLKDQIGPSSRYQYSLPEMAQYFEFPITQEYRIPWRAKLRAALKEFYQHPFAVLGYGGVFLYTRARRQSVNIVSNPVWNIDTSTKH